MALEWRQCDGQGLPLEVRQGAQKVIESLSLAYCPYSDFPVAAGVFSRARDGAQSLTVGVNVENASYGGTICAERSAICAAVSLGRSRPFLGIIVASDLPPTSPASPCGLCRQVIREFCEPDCPIYLVGTGFKALAENGEESDRVGLRQRHTTELLSKPFPVAKTTLGDLLPHSFGPEQLKGVIER